MKKARLYLIVASAVFAVCDGAALGYSAYIEKTEKPVAEVEFQTAGVVVIDPARQGCSFRDEKEPIGPGASKKGNKYSAGSVGSYSGMAESKLCLDIAMQLKTELEKRGYTIILTRTSEDTLISNAERAEIASTANADVFLRLYGDDEEDDTVEGALCYCPTTENKYVGAYADESMTFSQCMLNAYCVETGFENRGITTHDKNIGMNWCNTVSTSMMLGCLTNQQDDTQMANKTFQKTMVNGLADGVDEYFDTSVEASVSSANLVQVSHGMALSSAAQNDNVSAEDAYDQAIQSSQQQYQDSGTLPEGTEACYLDAIKWYLAQQQRERAEELRDEINEESTDEDAKQEINALFGEPTNIVTANNESLELTTEIENQTELETSASDSMETDLVKETESESQLESEQESETQTETQTESEPESEQDSVTQLETAAEALADLVPEDVQEQVENVLDEVINTETNVTEEETQEEEAEAISPYQKVVEEYQAAVNAGRDNIDSYSQLNMIALNQVYSEDSSIELEYALYDVDGNGTDELLVSNSYVDGGSDTRYRVMDLYGTDGTSAHRMFENDTLAERSTLTIYEDGTLYIEGSGGAAIGSGTFYRIGDDGYTPKVTQQYQLDFNLYPDTPWYNDSEQLTVEEYDARLENNYTAVDLTSLKWWSVNDEGGVAE